MKPAPTEAEIHNAYSRLGLHQDATLKDAKRAFKKIAWELHPDKNGNEEDFKAASNAYDLLNEYVFNPKKGAGGTAKASPVFEKENLDFMAQNGYWAGIFHTAAKDTSIRQELKMYALSLLEQNTRQLMEANQKGILEFLCGNVESRNVRIAIINWFQDIGEGDRAQRIISDFANLRRWGCLAQCAASLDSKDNLGALASTLLEKNADLAIASGQKEACAFLWKRARLAGVRRAAMVELAKQGEPRAVREAMDELAAQKEWGKIIKMSMDIPQEQRELRKHAVSIIESSLDMILNSGYRSALLFMGSVTSSDRTRRRIVDRLVESGDFDTIKHLLDSISSEQNWTALVKAFHQLPPGHSELRNHIIALLESDLHLIAGSKETDVLVFLYNNSRTEGIGRVIFEIFRAEGNFFPAKDIFSAMADKGRWLEIHEEAASLPMEMAELREYAVSLLEKNSKHVIASGHNEMIGFLCQFTRSQGVVVDALDSAAKSDHALAKDVLDIMAGRNMWKEINAGMGRFIAKPELKEYCLNLMETNVNSVLQTNRVDVVLSLWENTQTQGMRQFMLEKLVEKGRKEMVKPILDIMAQRKKWGSLTYCTEELLIGKPDLRKHGLSLMEENIEAIMAAGNHEAAEFVSRNTRRKDVLDVINGVRQRPGIFHRITGSVAGKVKGAVEWMRF